MTRSSIISSLKQQITMELIIIADPHLGRSALLQANNKAVEYGRWTQTLLQRVLEQAKSMPGWNVDLVVLPGDLIEHGWVAENNGLEELKAIRAVMDSSGMRYCVIPGNHDGSLERFLEVFPTCDQIIDVGGYRIMPMLDTWDQQDVTHRHAGDMSKLKAAGGDGQPIIVVQHGVIFPKIQEDNYPFNLPDTEAIHQQYRTAGVVLSISGHHHRGSQPINKDAVSYLAAPALHKEPFSYLHVKLDAADCQVERIELQLPEELKLHDLHIHTHFCLCASETNIDEALDYASAMGVTTSCLVNHSTQLYGYRVFKVLDQVDKLLEARQQGKDRVQECRQYMQRYHDKGILVGLELDIGLDGQPIILPQDLHGWDLVFGALHWLPTEDLWRSDPAAAIDTYIGLLETFFQVVPVKIDILAHPFREIRAAAIEPPGKLYELTAQLLLEHNCAAEINFHNNRPSVEFVRTCIKHGVKLSLGSDCHQPWQAGNLQMHLKLLELSGVPSRPDALAEVLYQPPRLSPRQ